MKRVSIKFVFLAIFILFTTADLLSFTMASEELFADKLDNNMELNCAKDPGCAL
ncbi:hypothetical protein Ancab_018652, partial [Ancistrocladus abbreviatus]